MPPWALLAMPCYLIDEGSLMFNCLRPEGVKGCLIPFLKEFALSFFAKTKRCAKVIEQFFAQNLTSVGR